MANIKDKMLYFVGNKLLKYVYKNPQKKYAKANKDRQGGCRQDVP